MIRSGIIAAVFLLSSLALQAQYIYYFVQFTDKGASTQNFSLSTPQAYLSQKAIERRNLFSIPLSHQDLPIDNNYVSAVLNEVDGYKWLKYKTKWLNGIVLEVQDSAQVDPLKNLSFVANIEQIHNDNYVGLKPSKKFEEAVGSTHKTNETVNYGEAKNQIEQLNVHVLHEAGLTGKNVSIAVLDAGFELMENLQFFDSAYTNNQIKGTYNFVAKGQTVYQANIHGTFVSSVMAANKPGELVGIAPHANYYLMLTEDVFRETKLEEFSWIEAAEMADSIGVDIINTSLGYTTFDDSTQNYTYNDMNGSVSYIARAATIAAQKGIFVVNSAGNSGNNSWRYIGTPGDAKLCLTAGSVDYLGNYSSFSSVGPSSDMRIKPELASMGQATATANPLGEVGNYNGTSFSAPLLSGAIACLIQGEKLPPNQVYEALFQSASQANNPDSLLGYGIPNFLKAYELLYGLNLSENITPTVEIWPNPVANEASFVLQLNSNAPIKVVVFSSGGPKISEQVLSSQYVNKGKSVFQFSTQNLNAGAYIVLVYQNDTKIATTKFIKQ